MTEKYFQKQIRCKFYRKLQIIEDFKEKIKQWKTTDEPINDFLKKHVPIYENYEKQGHLCQEKKLTNHSRHKNIYYEALNSLYNSMITDLKLAKLWTNN